MGQMLSDLGVGRGAVKFAFLSHVTSLPDSGTSTCTRASPAPTLPGNPALCPVFLDRRCPTFWLPGATPNEESSWATHNTQTLARADELKHTLTPTQKASSCFTNLGWAPFSAVRGGGLDVPDLGRHLSSSVLLPHYGKSTLRSLAPSTRSEPPFIFAHKAVRTVIIHSFFQ